jgi:hypothetical protein
VDGSLQRLVEEVHVFAPITSAPVHQLQVQKVAVGTSHTALLTGENWRNCFISENGVVRLGQVVREVCLGGSESTFHSDLLLTVRGSSM